MKKTYIIPANRVHNVQPCNMMASSPTAQTLSSGGSNTKTGAPTAAEVREWNCYSVMDEEW